MWTSRFRQEGKESRVKYSASAGRKVAQATAAAHVTIAARDKPTTARVRYRSISSPAKRPTNGRASRVAQNVKRSNVSTSKARPMRSQATGVVPPSPNRRANQKPMSKGRRRTTLDPRIKMKGKARTSAPHGMQKKFRPHPGVTKKFALLAWAMGDCVRG